MLANPFQRRFFKTNDLHELFTLGDVGPQQSTETGAIFAGTGSEIKIRKRKQLKSEKKKDSNNPGEQPVEKKPHLKFQNSDHTDYSRNNNNKAENELVNFTADFENKSDVISKNVLENHDSALKKRKKKKAVVTVDGFHVNHVEKKEVFKKEKSIENTEKTATNEDDILLGLFRTSGIHSAMKHDKIEQSSTHDYLLIEKEAEKVAKKAVDALRQSRKDCRKNGLSVPTWTGSCPKNIIKKKTLFGKKSNQGISTQVSAPMDKNSVCISSNNSVDISSSTLLARMRSRSLNVETSESSSFSQSTEHILLKDIQTFMLQRQDNLVSTDEITAFFQTRINKGQNVLFKELLKQVCSFEKSSTGQGNWSLKQEFR